jgi:histidyl-tRNA synthetase
VGFSVGIERVLLLLEARGVCPESGVDVYLVHSGVGSEVQAFALAEALRQECPKLRLMVHCGGGQFKQQFKKADKSNAKIALILGETELKLGTVSLKFLRENREQLSLSKNAVHPFLRDYLGNML